MASDTSSQPKEYRRSGLFHLIASLIGLGAVRRVSFSDSDICLHHGHRQTYVSLHDINTIRITGFIFWTLRITSSGKMHAICGLRHREAHEIGRKISLSEEIVWKKMLDSESRQLWEAASWIGKVRSRSVFQRHSVFSRMMEIAKSLDGKFGSALPNNLKAHKSGIDLLEIREFLNGECTDREVINSEYIEREVDQNKDLFDQIEANPLTEEQRRAVVVDDDSNLVVAAAGSGKTSVIVAKTAWLLARTERLPGEVLMLAFARDARFEMKQRLENRIEDHDTSDVSVHTFHSFGLEVAGQATGKKPSLSKLAEDERLLLRFIDETVRRNLRDKGFRKSIYTWFGEHFAKYRSIFEFENQGSYWDYLRANNIRSLKDEKLKSYEECQIANYLFLNGVNYEYERNYEHDTATTQRRQYQPDFYLPDYGLYIEHLGLKGFGRTAPFVDRKSYIASLRWKRELHKKHGTTMIETYSCEKAQGILTQRLHEKLEAEGVDFSQIDPEDLLELKNGSQKISAFTNLIKDFLQHFKGQQFTREDLTARAISLADADRCMAFIDVFMPIIDAYQKRLSEEKAIDFHDMIAMATQAIESGRHKPPYRYVLIDEFQDISTGRAKLIQALQNSNPDLQTFCVGDDWQAIFRFAGSDIGVMREFEKFFGKFERSDLVTTFRSNSQIAQQATDFVLKNNFQIQKNVESIRKSNQVSVYVGFVEKGKMDHAQVLQASVERITQSEDFVPNSRLLVLGRYNLQKYNSAFGIDYAGMLRRIADNYDGQLRIDYKTVHRSKGTESEYVIVLNVTGEMLGFPNELVDDPVMNMVLSEPEVFPNAEERRLFYVALTRAKDKVFLITESGKASPFINEIIQSPFDVEIIGEGLAETSNCSECVAGTLRLKVGDFEPFWGCSNYPYCTHTERACPHCKKGLPTHGRQSSITCQVCKQSVEACPKKGCKGWLRMRSGKYGNFWGCTEYFRTGCDYTRNARGSPARSRRRRHWDILGFFRTWG